MYTYISCPSTGIEKGMIIGFIQVGCYGWCEDVWVLDDPREGQSGKEMKSIDKW